MKRNSKATLAALAMSVIGSVALMGAAATVAAPAQADPTTDAFVSALTNAGLADAGLTGIDPATAVAVGQSVCPRLVEPGQNVANVAAQVADAIGRPLGPATMFTGLAISVFCPTAVTQLANGQSPIPFPLFGL